MVEPLIAGRPVATGNSFTPLVLASTETRMDEGDRFLIFVRSFRRPRWIEGAKSTCKLIPEAVGQEERPGGIPSVQQLGYGWMIYRAFFSLDSFEAKI